jgi:hypothetical protein
MMMMIRLLIRKKYKVEILAGRNLQRYSPLGKYLQKQKNISGEQKSMLYEFGKVVLRRIPLNLGFYKFDSIPLESFCPF